MIKIRIFISYKWEDKEYYDGLNGLLQNPNNNYVHIVIEEREDLRSKGENSVKDHLRRIIQNCDRVICLIGQDTHNSKWVQYELEVANSQKKRIIAVRVPGTTGGVPNLIRDRRISIIKWDANIINNALI